MPTIILISSYSVGSFKTSTWLLGSACMILSVHAAFLCVVSWMFSSTWGGGGGFVHSMCTWLLATLHSDWATYWPAGIVLCTGFARHSSMTSHRQASNPRMAWTWLSLIDRFLLYLVNEILRESFVLWLWWNSTQTWRALKEHWG